MIDAEPFIIRTDAVITTAAPIMIDLYVRNIEGEPIISDHKALMNASAHNSIRCDEVILFLHTIMAGARSLIPEIVTRYL